MVMAGDRVQAQADFCSLVADYILPLNVQGGLSLRWINNSTAHDGLTSSSQLVNIIKGANYFYYTPIGTGLKNHVLTPYWTNYCNDQTSNGGRIRPLLVIVITDGWVLSPQFHSFDPCANIVNQSRTKSQNPTSSR